jgi:hypothetical protein
MFRRVLFALAGRLAGTMTHEEKTHMPAPRPLKRARPPPSNRPQLFIGKAVDKLGNGVQVRAAGVRTSFEVA